MNIGNDYPLLNWTFKNWEGRRQYYMLFFVICLIFCPLSTLLICNFYASNYQDIGVSWQLTKCWKVFIRWNFLFERPRLSTERIQWVLNGSMTMSFAQISESARNVTPGMLTQKSSVTIFFISQITLNVSEFLIS